MATSSTEASAVPMPVPVPISNTKITDINIDCLEKVFDHLSFEDFLSVADAHTKLRKAADLVYRLKYKNKVVYISSLRTALNQLKVFFNEYDRMFIYSLKSILKTFRCFGHNISRVEIHSMIFNGINYNIHLSYLMFYIGEYCTDELKYLDLMTLTVDALNHIAKPLIGIKHLKIWDNGLTTNLLNEKFPNLKHLQINYGSHLIRNGQCNAVDFENIEKYFPYIDQMVIESDYSPNTYSLSDYQRTESVFDVATLKNFKSFTEYRNECSNIRFPFDHLDQICLRIDFRNDNDFYDFFRKYPSITKLMLNQKHYSKHKFEAKDLNVVKLANELPWLKQIDVKCCKFTPNVAIQWINHFKLLEKFQFHFKSHSEYMELQTYLSSEWQSFCSIDGDKQMCDLIRNPLQTN